MRTAVEWLRWDCEPGSAEENMATDEVLLESVAEIGKPVLRFYSWSEPAATFGYFQRYAEVARMTALRPLVRRPTGGGLVPHAADWTYSLVFPPSNGWYQLKAVESYQRVHAWVQAAFLEIAVPTDLAPRPSAAAAGECFLRAEEHDVLWRNKKIAGGAQRRNRKGLLIQGSIQPPAGISRQQWESAFCKFAEDQWAVRWSDFRPGIEFGKQVADAVRQKFGLPEYNRRR